MMRKLLKKLAHPFLKFGFAWYYRKPRKFTYKEISVLIHPDVFPPYFTFSTKILLKFIKSIDLNDKTFLELGCGSGIISLFAAKKGAIVTATDINDTALAYLKKAAMTNSLDLEILKSDIFDELANRQFEFIVINPPYYPRDPSNMKEHAWFCGANFEYFEKLFKNLPSYLVEDNNTFMILSEDCDLQKITQIARKNKLQLRIVHKKSSWIESNNIYKVDKID